MRCPICNKTVSVEGNPYVPFCGKRCQLIDLDNWLSERYRIPTANEAREHSLEASSTDPATKGNRG